MTSSELEAMVRAVVADVLAQMSPYPPAEYSRDRALVLITGAMLGFDEALAGLRKVQEAGIKMDLVQTEGAKRVLDQRKIAALGIPEITQNLIGEHPLLIIPTLTTNTVAKVAHGVADSLACNVMQEFIMLDRPIVASRTAACPDSRAKRAWFPNMPANYAEMLRENLRTLSSFGVRMTGSVNLGNLVIEVWRALQDGRPTHWAPPVAAEPSAPAAPSAAPTAPVAPVAPQGSRIECGQRVISERIVKVLDPGTVLVVRPDAVVTALARDAAAAGDVQIVSGEVA